eukprot:gnl/Chilomastix_cuspidata/2702.p2 GENE.gnl/Chilomastix_cuspidata/2702~~gnl/Chilomastix_cuspidata/2702.p2  ORF type:complete len:184 (-),score=30.15 gnl/Chilomastix_cuspidata/2702:386-937(-)
MLKGRPLCTSTQFLHEATGSTTVVWLVDVTRNDAFDIFRVAAPLRRPYHMNVFPYLLRLEFLLCTKFALCVEEPPFKVLHVDSPPLVELRAPRLDTLLQHGEVERLPLLQVRELRLQALLELLLMHDELEVLKVVGLLLNFLRLCVFTLPCKRLLDTPHVQQSPAEARPCHMVAQRACCLLCF